MLWQRQLAESVENGRMAGLDVDFDNWLMVDQQGQTLSCRKLLIALSAVASAETTATVSEDAVCEMVAARIMARRAPAAKSSAAAPFLPVAASTMTQTGIDYERLCMCRIKACGWQAEMTKTSGDFGVDLIAQKENSVKTLRVAVQCKRYSGNVGVDAVQQVHTGRPSTMLTMQP